MDDAKTVWCGNLADQVTEELLYELFLQVAPLERVKIPTDREGRRSNFGFITFKHEISVPYAVQLLHGTRMFDKSLNVRPRNGASKQDTQNAQVNAIQRSFSYPNDMYNQNKQMQHTRFTDPAEIRQQYISYDNLVHDNLINMGQLMNVNYDYPGNNYANPYGNTHGEQHNSGNNRGNSRPQWERDSYRDRDKDRGRKEYDRERPRNDRERDRRHEYSNSSRHNRRNNDRSGGRRRYNKF